MATKKTRIQLKPNENAEAAELALAPVLERLDVHGEMLKHIVQLLTEEKQSDGPTLYDLLADLIKRIDGQSAYLKDLTVAVAKLGMNLPLDLIKAIDDIPHRTNGHPNEGDPA